MHRPAPYLASSLLALFLLTATATAQEARSRDSAGVRIIENSARQDAPVRFRLGDKPLLEVGGIEPNPDEEFEHKQGYLRGVRLSNGGLAVMDVSRVHYFDASGKRTRIVGRRGGGPEEFQYLTSICRTRGDTIVLNDSHNRRLSILDGSGRILRTIPQGDNGSAPFDFCLDDGSFVLQRSIGELGARQHRVTRLRTDGSVVSLVGTFDANGFDMVTMVAPTLAASGDGLYHGDPFASEIREYDSSGSLRRVIRTADKGDRITDAEAEKRMAMTIPRNVTAAERTARMERLRARPYARTWPVFRHLTIGSDGTIWVQDFNKTYPSPDGWTAIDSTGRIVGRLVIPAVPERTIRPEVQSFGRDYVMLRRFDADGATSLAIYPLVRTDGRGR
jgi:hypothetical protein